MTEDTRDHMTDTTLRQPAMPLSFAQHGQVAIIQQINGGRRLRQRLLDLGLNHGTYIRVLKNERHDPMLIAVKEDSRLALGRDMTHQILVTPVAQDNHEGET